MEFSSPDVKVIHFIFILQIVVPKLLRTMTFSPINFLSYQYVFVPPEKEFQRNRHSKPNQSNREKIKGGK